MGHGGELETGCTCTCGLIWCAWSWQPPRPGSSAARTISWTPAKSGALIANPPWSDDTTSGIYGDGKLGTAEKGRLWLAAAVEEKLETVRGSASNTPYGRAHGRGGRKWARCDRRVRRMNPPNEPAPGQVFGV